MFYSKNLRKFKVVKHCFFSRKGGFSKGVYKGLNCGRGSKDDKKNIFRNLKYVSKKMKINSKKLILMHQTHSNRVIEIKKNSLKKKIFSDAIITKAKGLALGVVTADCVPILLFDKRTKTVGCIHAGWRGALKGIIKNNIKKISKLNSKSEIYASIGPCIGKKNYEIDLKFYMKFMAKSKKNKKYFTKKNKRKKFFNLRKFVADKLFEEKVNFDHVNYDTFKEKNYFFSFRRSSMFNEEDYGRCISVIRLN